MNTKPTEFKVEMDGVSVYDEETKTLRIMAYNYKNDLDYDDLAVFNFDIDLTKYDFKNALKKSKTDSFWAGEVADVYIDGDANIKIKSSPKKAIKLLKYWENKKDVPEDKKSFVHYRFKKAYENGYKGAKLYIE